MSKYKPISRETLPLKPHPHLKSHPHSLNSLQTSLRFHSRNTTIPIRFRLRFHIRNIHHPHRLPWPSPINAPQPLRPLLRCRTPRPLLSSSLPLLRRSSLTIHRPSSLCRATCLSHSSLFFVSLIFPAIKVLSLFKHAFACFSIHSSYTLLPSKLGPFLRPCSAFIRTLLGIRRVLQDALQLQDVWDPLRVLCYM